MSTTSILSSEGANGVSILSPVGSTNGVKARKVDFAVGSREAQLILQNESESDRTRVVMRIRRSDTGNWEEVADFKLAP